MTQELTERDSTFSLEWILDGELRIVDCDVMVQRS